MYIDGNTQIEYEESPLFYYDDYKKRILKVKIGGSADMGQIYLDNELLVNQPEEFFVALREALNNLWEERIY